MTETSGLNRRTFMGYFAGLGITSSLFPGVLWAKVAAGEEITLASIASAEEIAGVHFDPAEREMMLDGLKQQEQRIELLHKTTLPNSVAPSIVFDPLPPGFTPPRDVKRPMVRSRGPAVAASGSLEELAFLPVTQLSRLIES